MKSLAVYRLLIYCLIQSCYAIQLEGNGYEDIVVFIGDSIPEDLLLLRKIEVFDFILLWQLDIHFQ